jgi:hypothetical protein
VLGEKQKAFDADAMPVTPYLGRDSLLPLVEVCRREGKGIFVVLKTSNEGSRDYQDQVLQATGRPLYETIAKTVNELGKPLIGDSGYSSVERWWVLRFQMMRGDYVPSCRKLLSWLPVMARRAPATGMPLSVLTRWVGRHRELVAGHYLRIPG